MITISVEDRISVVQRNIVHFVIVLAIILLEQKYYTYQCRQFVTAAAICADKTLITLNVLNSNEHAHAAQQTGVLCRTLSGFVAPHGHVHCNLKH